MSPPFFYFIPDRNGDDKPDGEPEILLDGLGFGFFLEFSWQAVRLAIASAAVSSVMIRITTFPD